ncbi:hypothetical protein MQE23_05190 [Streptomyces sp. HP-A2021]|uniref:hypothetical protein n=1 Tax=Streptomyces sp. HP-A2021 TaxID=2927875 RepID=UPI001FAF8196|nr:hypothetical protein [Streptomyces sp. HP-A2021]UOB08480.1 hypothetical protein MQE23_05190 [Streptomyces sp. HP-A2021]
MHRTARTAPGTGSARPRIAILAAVVLVLLAALGIAGPPPGTSGEPVVGTVAAAGRDGPHGPCVGDVCGTVWAGGPCADDGCGTVCVNDPCVGDACGTVWAGGPRADDGCGTVRAVRAAPRQEPYGELPAPRGHLAARAPGTDVTPADSAARLPEPAVHTPSSALHAPGDRGRAPPATSGI